MCKGLTCSLTDCTRMLSLLDAVPDDLPRTGTCPGWAAPSHRDSPAPTPPRSPSVPN